MKHVGLLFALGAAFLYAFVVIIEKAYINDISSDKMLFLMYLGGGVGLYIIHLSTKKKTSIENKITRKEVPKIIGIVICELLASILLIEAVKKIDSSLVSLLLVFEVVMTSLCAYYIFKDPITKNEFIAIILVVLASIILNFKNGILSEIGLYSLLVVGACFFWGVENNLTASISRKEPAFFTSIKCMSVSLLYLFIVIIKGDLSISYPILILYGFGTYGFGILLYALSTRYLGASKSMLVFSFSAIFGSLLSFIIFKEIITYTFIVSAILMIIGIMMANYDIKK